MNLLLASTGSYPRVGDSADLQILRRTIAAAESLANRFCSLRTRG